MPFIFRLGQLLIKLCINLTEDFFSLSKYSNPFAIESLGRLVLLGFDITAFTPVAYQRHSL